MKGAHKSISGGRLYLAGITGVLLLTALDQLTKYLAVVKIRPAGTIWLIRDILCLEYIENRGMAFGMLEGKLAFFIILCLVFLSAMIYVYVRMPKTREYLPLAGVMALVASGALGNLIDRVLRGFVVEFIYVSVIDFPIFNMADIYVVCGGILLVILVCFGYKDEDFEFLRFSGKKK